MAEKTVMLQINVPETLRARMKAQAALKSLEMKELGLLVLDHILTLMEADKTPAELQREIDKYKKERSKSED